MKVEKVMQPRLFFHEYFLHLLTERIQLGEKWLQTNCRVKQLDLFLILLKRIYLVIITAIFEDITRSQFSIIQFHYSPQTSWRHADHFAS